MLERTGVPTKEDLATVSPPPERLEEGPVSIIECFQKIPCDPCYHSCPRGAIMPFSDLNDLPKMDFAKCNGCGLCISNCPGLAIFVIEKNYTPGRGLVKMPYEFLPLPKKGEEVILLDREGQELGTGLVERIQNKEKQDKTSVIWVSMPGELIMEARNIRVVE
ncbi:MAG: 4Fe-4S binding protein [Halanaerobium sp.]|nr:4Fe-4S binding protein [Halanaerobium sp.]